MESLLPKGKHCLWGLPVLSIQPPEQLIGSRRGFGGSVFEDQIEVKGLPKGSQVATGQPGLKFCSKGEKVFSDDLVKWLSRNRRAIKALAPPLLREAVYTVSCK